MRGILLEFYTRIIAPSCFPFARLRLSGIVVPFYRSIDSVENVYETNRRRPRGVTRKEMQRRLNCEQATTVF